MKCKDCEYCINNDKGKMALCTFNSGWEPTQVDNDCRLDILAKPLTCGDCTGIDEDTACLGCSDDMTCPQEGCVMNSLKGEIALHEFLQRLEATGYDICQYLDQQKKDYVNYKEKCNSRYKFYKDKNVLDVYIYGDITYGIQNAELKWIIVVNDYEKNNVDVSYLTGQVMIFSKKEWEYEAKKNSSIFLQCVMTLPQFKIKETYVPKYKIDKEKVYNEFLKDSEAFWRIGKEYYGVDENAKLYIWYALNLLFFAQDIILGGRIDYMSSINYYYDIINSKNDWNKFAEHFEVWYEREKNEIKKLIDKKEKK